MFVSPRKPVLYTELLLLTLGVPLLLWLVLPPRAILPVVWIMAFVCYFITRAVTGQSFTAQWGWSAVRWANLGPILLRFMLCAALLFACTWWFKPDLLFNFISSKPRFWAVVMVLYPLLSVIPQEIIFRTYMFARFRHILTPPFLMIVVSGLSFGIAHLVLDNWVAPLLCTIGGVIFSYTYHKTRSLALVSIEHALYGNFIFTLGLGRYFYHGAVAAAQ